MNGTALNHNIYWPITFLASFLIWVMFAGLLAMWLIDGRIKREQVLHALLASLIAWVVTEVVKSFFPTLRPFQVNGAPPLTITIPSTHAFPSFHAAVAFAVATTIFLHNKKLGLIFVVFALLVGLGRIWSNVHSFIDIIGGGIIGVVTAIAVERVHLRKLLG